MDKKIASYETMFIVDVDLGEEGVNSVVEKFTSLIGSNGSNVEVKEWGKKRLAYPINDKPEGYYVLVDFTAPTDFPAELERIYNITEGIMRSIVLAKEA